MDCRKSRVQTDLRKEYPRADKKDKQPYGRPKENGPNSCLCFCIDVLHIFTIPQVPCAIKEAIHTPP